MTVEERRELQKYYFELVREARRLGVPQEKVDETVEGAVGYEEKAFRMEAVIASVEEVTK